MYSIFRSQKRKSIQHCNVFVLQLDSRLCITNLCVCPTPQLFHHLDPKPEVTGSHSQYWIWSAWHLAKQHPACVHELLKKITNTFSSYTSKELVHYYYFRITLKYILLKYLETDGTGPNCNATNRGSILNYTFSPHPKYCINPWTPPAVFPGKKKRIQIIHFLEKSSGTVCYWNMLL